MVARERIEREFDLPLRDVIIGLREQGCTWRSVALALEVSTTCVKFWRHGFGLPLTGERLRDDLSEYPSKTEKASQRLGYRDTSSAIVDLRMSGLTVFQVAEKLGVNVRTITRNYPPGFAGTVFVKTEKYKRTRNRGGNWGQG